jgi:hypothetical protein
MLKNLLGFCWAMMLFFVLLIVVSISNLFGDEWA